MSNYMKKIARMLEVELNEEFYITELMGEDYVVMYRLSECGCEIYEEHKGWKHAPSSVLEGLLRGEYHLGIKYWDWKPIAGRKYYVPYVTDGEPSYAAYTWGEDANSDKKRLVAGLICKNEKEALDMAEEMIIRIRYFED